MTEDECEALAYEMNEVYDAEDEDFYPLSKIWGS